MSKLRDHLKSVRLKRSDKCESKADLVESVKVDDSPAVVTQVHQNASAHIKQDNSATDRVLKTSILFINALTLGLCTPLLGETLVHLELFFGTSTATMSIALTLQAVGGLLGAIICGLVFDYGNPELQFAVASFFQGMSAMVATYIGGLVPFMIAICLLATSIGFIMASGQSYCVSLWNGHRFRDPLLHTWAAMRSLGAMVGPFITAQFLIDLPQQQEFASNTTNWPTSLLVETNNDTKRYESPDELTTPSSWNLTSVNSSVLEITVPGVEKVCFAYVTVGSLALVSNLLFVISCSLDCIKGKATSSEILTSSLSSKRSHSSRTQEDNGDRTKDDSSMSCSETRSENTPIGGDCMQLDRCLYLIFIVQVFFFCHIYPYVNIIPYMYITTFVIKYLNFPVQQASLLMSLFFGFQLAGRVIIIPVAEFVRPRTTLIVNLLATTVSLLLLLAFISSWPSIIWITIPMASFSFSTTYGAVTLWISDRVPLTGRVSAIIRVGIASGAMVSPIIVGQLLESSTPMWFVYVLAISSVAEVVLLFVLECYGARYGNRVTRYAKVDHKSKDDAAGVTKTNIDYKSVGERDDLTPNIDTSELQNLQNVK